MKIDTHLHSEFSHDCDVEPQVIVERAKATGLDGVCITDHNFLEPDTKKMLESLSDENLIVLCGMEYHTSNGHILVYGLDKNPFGEKYLPIQEVVDHINSLGGVVVPSHPYERNYTHELCDKVFNLKGIAALETINASKSQRMNEQAEVARQDLKLPGTGGSDAHFPEWIGSAYTIFQDRVSDMKDFVEALRKGDFYPQLATTART